jgi:hypothetical protein
VRRLVRAVLVALDLVSVAGALQGIAPGSARALVLVLVAVLGLVLVTVAAILAAGLLAQRQPPYPL